MASPNANLLASAKVEGFRPSPEFLADLDAMVAGTITEDQLRANLLARAKSKMNQATESTAQIGITTPIRRR